jgi:hypothetical protein
MKALSLMEPWAWLVVQGIKDVENRTWRTNFRGRILIHASRTFDTKGYSWLTTGPSPLITGTFAQGFPRPEEFLPTMGGIVGEVEITGCVASSDSPWFFGPFGFTLQHAKRLPFRSLRGMPGLFEVANAQPE